MIHIPPDAGQVLRFADAELCRLAPWMAEATVAIGPVEWAPVAAGLRPRRGPGHPEGFLLVGETGRYAVGAKTERGALYGVYALLERLGARWPHPGRTVQPEAGALPDLDEVVEPSYDLRGTYFRGLASTREVLTLLEWGARRGLNALQVENEDGVDREGLLQAAAQRGITLAFGPLEAWRTAGRCFKHSLGNPYGCSVNPALFQRVAGFDTAMEPYADLLSLGRPANLATVIRQDLEDYFRESYRAFFMAHNGPLSWWTCPLNFDVYARTLWDLNTDPAEVLVEHAGGDEGLERSLGLSEEAGAAALRNCDTSEHHAAAVTATAGVLPPGSLERALHAGDGVGAVRALESMPAERLGRFGEEIYLPLLRRRTHDAASR